jgi:hypothetical protein
VSFTTGLGTLKPKGALEVGESLSFRDVGGPVRLIVSGLDDDGKDVLA